MSYEPEYPENGNKWLLLMCIVIAAAVYGWYWKVHHGPAYTYPKSSEKPVAVPARLPDIVSPPVQKNLEHPRTVALKGYTLTALASYTVTARVLGFERYRLDRPASLAPVDLALGWGLMSNKKVISQLSISQFARFYYWKAKEYPIEREQIERMSANTHIIPASKRVEEEIGDLDEGDSVTLGGYLVNVTNDEGFTWNTSLTRTDTGDGGCEIFYVEYVVRR